MSNREARPYSRVVWIEEERTFGEILGSMGGFFTTVAYSRGGVDYEVLMENDEFTLLEDFLDRDSED